MRYFADLLAEDERKIKKTLAKLEDLSGGKSEDVRLMLQHSHRLKRKMASLNLDPADTSGQELYEALKVKLAKDFSLASRAWGINDHNMASKTIELSRHSSGDRKVLSIKCSSMKRLLKQSPPKKVMKQLNYRSLDSMLKREDVRKVIGLAFFLESGQWNSRLADKISKLASSDYEMRSVEFIDLTNPKYGPLFTDAKPVSYVPLMGTVILLPSKTAAEQSPGIVLLCLRAAELMEAESQYLSTKQFSPDFGKTAERVFINFEPAALCVNGEPFVSSLDAIRSLDPENETSAHKTFTNLHPSLHWWQDAADLAKGAETAPVSLNIADMAANIAGGLDYANRYFHNFIPELKKSIIARYAASEQVKDYFADQIDDSLIALEELTQGSRLVPQQEEIYS